MSKTKTKKARRELKRDSARKLAAHQKNAAKASTPSKPPATKPKPKKPSQPHMQASQKPPIPFGPYDHILLVGDGDFSFTSSLTLHHGCANVTASSWDTEAEVHTKYPSFTRIQKELRELSPPVPLHHGIDATKLSSYKHLRCKRDDEDEVEGWDTICFMFPHTGGLSTDVNRQVRANQTLISSFFASCLEASTPKARLATLLAQTQPSPMRPRAPFLRLGGKVLVALFEGEPYTLWNIRDLARHAGLKVVESWRFEWGDYAGYGHVRTLGAVEGVGAWRGEEREARMYVFEKVDLVADSEEEGEMRKMGMGVGGAGGKKGGKRKRGGSESEEEGD